MPEYKVTAVCEFDVFADTHEEAEDFIKEDLQLILNPDTDRWKITEVVKVKEDKID
jgi:hypothetical protein